MYDTAGMSNSSSVASWQHAGEILSLRHARAGGREIFTLKCHYFVWPQSRWLEIF